jgi:hypothetical protein
MRKIKKSPKWVSTKAQRRLGKKSETDDLPTEPLLDHIKFMQTKISAIATVKPYK